jgi:MarR family transcriptional regulator, organic hydroperoxide resistance regulator
MGLCKTEVGVSPKKLPESADQFELSEHLPYLFRHIYAQLQAASAGHLAQFGVNVAVWRILAVLWQHGDLAHNELAELTSIEVSTLSRVSKSVQRSGLIRRKRTQADQRMVRVTLTEKGRELVQKIIPSALGMQAEIVGKLKSDDVKTLTKLLHVISDNLSAYGESEFDLPEEVATIKVAKSAAQTAKGAAKTSPKASPART